MTDHRPRRRRGAPRLHPGAARRRRRRHPGPGPGLPGRGGRGRRRRPAGDLLGRPRHPLRVARRPVPPRPGLRRLVQRARRPAAGPPARGLAPVDRAPPARQPRAAGATAATTRRTWCAPPRPRPRCSGTATSPRSTPRRSVGWPGCSSGCRCARPVVVRPGTRGGTAARSTPPAPCATRCATSASRARSPGAVAACGRAGWCCWST